LGSRQEAACRESSSIDDEFVAPKGQFLISPRLSDILENCHHDFFPDPYHVSQIFFAIDSRPSPPQCGYLISVVTMKNLFATMMLFFRDSHLQER
jgi:hypothetical protein